MAPLNAVLMPLVLPRFVARRAAAASACGVVGREREDDLRD